MTENAIDYGRFRVIRHNKGLSLHEMEQKTGIRSEYISRIERNQVPGVTMTTVLKLCQGLECSPADLFVTKAPQ
jgi:DNA-binding Xre family transcriptional regulator